MPKFWTNLFNSNVFPYKGGFHQITFTGLFGRLLLCSWSDLNVIHWFYLHLYIIYLYQILAVIQFNIAFLNLSNTVRSDSLRSNCKSRHNLMWIRSKRGFFTLSLGSEDESFELDGKVECQHNTKVADHQWIKGSFWAGKSKWEVSKLKDQFVQAFYNIFWYLFKIQYEPITGKTKCTTDNFAQCL